MIVVVEMELSLDAGLVIPQVRFALFAKAVHARHALAHLPSRLWSKYQSIQRSDVPTGTRSRMEASLVEIHQAID